MSMKLRELLNLTEQAPQPPQAATPAPVAPVSPSAPVTPSEPAMPDTGADTAPTPNDPSEYDFTRDFRAFEDSKNKAEAEAKKKLLDKMNKMVLGKKIVANASRGYGQPKTDYTIESVKKVSVEFWYKDWVVIVTDNNDKKFFLTPGVNIKIEQAGAEQSEEPAVDAAPTEPKAPVAPEKPEVPGNTDNSESPNNNNNNTAAPTPKIPKAPIQKPASAEPNVASEQPEEPESPMDLQKKKKLPVAEIAKMFKETVSGKIRPQANVTINVTRGGQYVFEVAAKDFKQPFDTRDFLLETKDVMKRTDSVDVRRIGLNYQFVFRLGK